MILKWIPPGKCCSGEYYSLSSWWSLDVFYEKDSIIFSHRNQQISYEKYQILTGEKNKYHTRQHPWVKEKINTTSWV
jgi:hypothetical protein